MPTVDSPLQIRPAQPNDVATIAQFNIDLASETENRQLEPERVLAGVAAFIADPGKGFYLVAERDGQVAGQLMVTYEWSDWRNGVFWWLQSVFVLPQYRRAGVFKALFSHLEAQARRRPDVCGLRLYVDAENRRAQGVYSRLGMGQSRYLFYETDFVLKESENSVGSTLQSGT